MPPARASLARGFSSLPYRSVSPGSTSFRRNFLPLSTRKGSVNSLTRLRISFGFMECDWMSWSDQVRNGGGKKRQRTAALQNLADGVACEKTRQRLGARLSAIDSTSECGSGRPIDYVVR